MSKRKDQETAEALETVSNQVPTSKFQKEQQIQNTDEALDVKVPESSFTLSKNPGKGSQLKQEAVAKVLNNGNTGGVPGMGISAAGSRGLSGGAGGVLGAANATPIADKSRSETRYGKKLDRIATKINFTPSEQVVAEYDESKPLADSADQDQGYNGTYRNEYARSQKVTGNTPAELLFDRSVDVLDKDELYFSQGQYVAQDGVAVEDTPTLVPTKSSRGTYVYPADDQPNYNAPCGNYRHKNIHMDIDEYGKLRAMYFDVVDESRDDLDEDTVNRASANALIDRNSAEIDRQNIDYKAGDEKAEIWSCLARAVKQPTRTVAFGRDCEAMTGGETFVSYRKGMTSLAYQLNRAVKDGITLVTPAVEALLGTLYSGYSNEVYANAAADLGAVLDGTHRATVKALNAAGNPGLMIQLYDSVAKYKTKQDLLLQPRGFRMHLQTADNNMNPLRVHKNLAKVYSATEVFSTIDRAYDPLLPICVTDKAALIHRRNMNQIAGFVDGLKYFKFKTKVSGSTQFVDYKIAPPSQACDNSYIHVLLGDSSAGHGKFTYADGVFTPNTDCDANKYVTVLVDKSSDQYDGTSAAGHAAAKVIDGVTYYEWQSPVQASTITNKSFIVKVPADVEVIHCEKTYAIDGGPFRYMYSDLRNNYVVTMGLPLTDGIIDYIEKEIGGKLYGLLPGNDGDVHSISIPMIHSTEYFSLWSFMICAATPFILNARTNDMRDVLYYEKNVEYPFSGLDSISEIGVKSFTNFTCDGYDSPLVAGQMKESTAIRWIMPEMFWTAGQETNSAGGVSETTVVMPFYMSENNFEIASDGTTTLREDQAAMSMPSIRSGARLSFLDKFYGMSEKDIRLSYDCVVPFIPDKASTGFSYKYATNADGIIGFVLSDSDATSAANADITIHEWLSQPRELGWSIDAPYGVLTPKVTGSITVGTSAGDFAQDDESATRGTSYRVKYWFGAGATAHQSNSVGQDILRDAAINVNRAANFTQNWFMVVANGKHPTVDHGMIFSLNQLFDDGDVIFGESMFAPFFNEAQGTSLQVNVVSLMKGLWTRIQKLPFVVSPFEGGDTVRGVASQSIDTSYDPYEIAYIFGLCGFRASDYRESIYNREKEVVNQGYLFVSDPWINASPIFREGGVASGIPASKGYEI